MKRTLWLAAALVVMIPAAGLAAQDETEQVSRTVPIKAGGTLTLKNFSGTVTITGSDRADVAIEATRRAPRERLDRIKLDIQSTGSGVTINANKRDWGSSDDRNNVVETTFDIQVPRSLDLDVQVFSSDVKVSGVDGQQRVHAFSGDLTLDGAARRVDAKTFSGRIDVSMAGTVDRPEVRAETFSGDIDLTVPETASADVSLDTFSGGLTSDLPLTFRSRSKRHLAAGLNTPDGSRPANALELKTFSGDVRLRR